MTVQTIAKINNTAIIIIENGDKRVPIRPICDALGVDHSKQLRKIKDDEILGPTVALRATVGKDGKERDMQTIPYKYVFGWLFSINSRNVAEDARKTVIRYKIACYDALYYHFTAHAEFLEEKQGKLEEMMAEIQELKQDFSQAKSKLSDAEKELKAVRDLSFEDWDSEKRQLKMNF